MALDAWAKVPSPSVRRSVKLGSMPTTLSIATHAGQAWSMLVRSSHRTRVQVLRSPDARPSAMMFRMCGVDVSKKFCHPWENLNFSKVW